MSNCCPPTIVFTSPCPPPCPPCPPPPCPKQHYKKGKARRCSSQAPKKKMLCVEMNGGGNGSNQCGDSRKKNFMEEVWKAMTPDMLNKLIDILVKDFNMSPSEACEFIKQQRDMSKQSQMTASGKCPCATDMVPAVPNMEVRNAMIREFMDVAACKLSDYMGMILCSRRTRRSKVMSKIMQDSLNSMFGTQEGDGTKVSKVTAFLADKFSLWIDNMFDDSMECPTDPAPEEEGGDGTGGEGNKDAAGEAKPADEGGAPPPPPAEEPEPPEEE